MKEHALRKIINKQFKIAKIDLKYDDICENQIPEWYRKHSCTSEENDKWRKWTEDFLKKQFKYTKDKAHIEAAWLNLNYGLKIKNGKSQKSKKSTI